MGVKFNTELEAKLYEQCVRDQPPTNGARCSIPCQNIIAAGGTPNCAYFRRPAPTSEEGGR